MTERKLSKSEARKVRKERKKRKQPATAVDVPLEKRPIPGPTVPRDDPNARMMFRLSLMDSSGRWGFDALSVEHIAMIAAISKNFERQTITEFIGVRGNKPIPWASMCPDARKRARKLELDLFDGLWELRLGGTERLWGLLDGNCFYPVWWDPDHEVCPSRMKHT